MTALKIGVAIQMVTYPIVAYAFLREGAWRLAAAQALLAAVTGLIYL